VWGRDVAAALDFPFDWIRRTLQPTHEQQARLEDLRISSHRALNALKASRRAQGEPTPVGRLDTVERWLTAMLDAVNTVRGVARRAVWVLK
jgi:LTXXQ motif family protein